MCEVASFKNFENSLATVKVMTKIKVAPFYLGHRVKSWPINLFLWFQKCFSKFLMECAMNVFLNKKSWQNKKT